MELVESFLKSALYKLNGMSSSWQEGLPKAVYNKVMSRMLEPLVKNVVDGILSQTVSAYLALVWVSVLCLTLYLVCFVSCRKFRKTLGLTCITYCHCF